MSTRGFDLLDGIGCSTGGVRQSGSQEVCYLMGRDVHFYDIKSNETRVFSPPMFESESGLSQSESFTSRLRIEDEGQRLNTSLSVKCCCHYEKVLFAYGEQRLHPKIHLHRIDNFEKLFTYEFGDDCVEIIALEFSEDGRYLGVLLHYPTIKIVVFDIERLLHPVSRPPSSHIHHHLQQQQQQPNVIYFEKELEEVYLNFRFQKEMVLVGYGLFNHFEISEEEELFSERFPLKSEDIENTFLQVVFDETQTNFYLLKESGGELFYFSKKNEDQDDVNDRQSPSSPLKMTRGDIGNYQKDEEDSSNYTYLKTVMRFNEEKMKSAFFCKSENVLIVSGERKCYFIQDLIVTRVMNIDEQIGLRFTHSLLKLQDYLFFESNDHRFLIFRDVMSNEEEEEDGEISATSTKPRIMTKESTKEIKRYHEGLDILKYNNKNIFLSYSEREIFMYDIFESLKIPKYVITQFGSSKIRKLFVFGDMFYLFNASKELISFKIDLTKPTNNMVEIVDVVPYPRNLKHMKEKHGHQVLMFDNNELIINSEFKLENERITSFYIASPKFFYFCTEESILKKYTLENDFLFLKKFKLEFPCLSFKIMRLTEGGALEEEEEEEEEEEGEGGEMKVKESGDDDDDESKLYLFCVSEDKSFRVYKNFRLVREISLVHLLCFKRFDNYNCLKIYTDLFLRKKKMKKSSRTVKRRDPIFYLGNKDGLFYSIRNNQIENYWYNHNPGKGIRNFLVMEFGSEEDGNEDSRLIITFSKKNEILYYSNRRTSEIIKVGDGRSIDTELVPFYQQTSSDDSNKVKSMKSIKLLDDIDEDDEEDVIVDFPKLVVEKEEEEDTVNIGESTEMKTTTTMTPGDDDGNDTSLLKTAETYLKASPSKMRLHDQKKQKKRMKKVILFRKKLIQKYYELKQQNEESIPSQKLVIDEFLIDETFVLKQQQKQKENLKKIHKELKKENLRNNYFVDVVFKKKFHNSVFPRYDVLTSFDEMIQVDNFPLPIGQTSSSSQQQQQHSMSFRKDRLISQDLIKKIRFHKRLESYDLHFYRNLHSLFQKQVEDKDYFGHLINESLFAKKIPFLPQITSSTEPEVERKELEFYQNFDLVSFYRIVNQMFLFKSRILEMKQAFNEMFEKTKSNQKEAMMKLRILHEKIRNLGEEIKNTLNLLNFQTQVIDPTKFVSKRNRDREPSSSQPPPSKDSQGKKGQGQLPGSEGGPVVVNNTQRIMEGIMEVTKIGDLDFDLFQFKKKKQEKNEDEEETEIVIDEKYKKALNKMMFGENILKNENKELNELKKLLKEQKKMFHKHLRQDGSSHESSGTGLSSSSSGTGSQSNEMKLFNQITEQLNLIFEEQQKKKKQQFAKLRNFRKEINEIQNEFANEMIDLKKKRFEIHEEIIRFELKILYLKKLALKKEKEKQDEINFLQKEVELDQKNNKFLNYFTNFEKKLMGERKRLNEKIEKNRMLDKHSFFNQNTHLLKLFKKNNQYITDEEKNIALYGNNEEKRSTYIKLKKKKIKNLNAIKKKVKEIEELSKNFEKLKKLKIYFEKNRGHFLKLKEKKKYKRVKNLFNLYFFLNHKQGKIEHEKRKKILQNFNSHVLIHKKIIRIQNTKNKRQSNSLITELENTVDLKKKIKKERWENEKKKIDLDEKEKLLHDFQMLKVNKEMQMVIKQKRPTSSSSGSRTHTANNKQLTKIEKRKEKEKKKFEKRKKLQMQIDYIKKLKKEKSIMMARKVRTLKRKIGAQRKKNSVLENQMSQLNEILKERKHLKKLQDTKKRKIKKERKMKKIRKEAKLKILTREQEREMLFLRREVDKYRKKTFPNFDGITLN